MTPAECKTREDIRREIDSLDNQLIELLAARFGYIRRMVDFKQDPSEARVDKRANEIIERVRARAAQRGFDPGLAATLWTEMMEWNIGFEERTIAARNRGEKGDTPA